MINCKLNTQVIICSVSIDGVAVYKMEENITVAMTTSKKCSNGALFNDTVFATLVFKTLLSFKHTACTNIINFVNHLLPCIQQYNLSIMTNYAESRRYILEY